MATIAIATIPATKKKYLRTIDDYDNITRTKKESIKNYRIAVLKDAKSSKDTPHLNSSVQAATAQFDGSWFLIPNPSSLWYLFKQKVCARLYRNFIGYAPHIDIVLDNFVSIASQGIKGFSMWKDAYDIKSRTLLGYRSLGDGRFTKNGVTKVLQGHASIAVLGLFFAECDMNGNNFGVQETEDAIVVWKIDDGESLELELLAKPIELQDIEVLPGSKPSSNFDMADIDKETVMSPKYQAEKLAMLQKLADGYTDIKKIFLEEMSSFAENMAAIHSHLGKTSNPCQDDLKEFQEGWQGLLDELLVLFEARSQQIKELLKLNPKQDTHWIYPGIKEEHYKMKEQQKTLTLAFDAYQTEKEQAKEGQVLAQSSEKLDVQPWKKGSSSDKNKVVS